MDVMDIISLYFYFPLVYQNFWVILLANINRYIIRDITREFHNILVDAYYN